MRKVVSKLSELAKTGKNFMFFLLKRTPAWKKYTTAGCVVVTNISYAQRFIHFCISINALSYWAPWSSWRALQPFWLRFFATFVLSSHRTHARALHFIPFLIFLIGYNAITNWISRWVRVMYYIWIQLLNIDILLSSAVETIVVVTWWQHTWDLSGPVGPAVL